MFGVGASHQRQVTMTAMWTWPRWTYRHEHTTHSTTAEQECSVFKIPIRPAEAGYEDWWKGAGTHLDSLELSCIQKITGNHVNSLDLTRIPQKTFELARSHSNSLEDT